MCALHGFLQIHARGFRRHAAVLLRSAGTFVCCHCAAAACPTSERFREGLVFYRCQLAIGCWDGTLARRYFRRFTSVQHVQCTCYVPLERPSTDGIQLAVVECLQQRRIPGLPASQKSQTLRRIRALTLLRVLPAVRLRAYSLALTAWSGQTTKSLLSQVPDGDRLTWAHVRRMRTVGRQHQGTSYG